MEAKKTRAFSDGSMMRLAAPQPKNRMEAKKTSKVKRLKHKSSFANLTDTRLQIIQVKGLDAAGQENLQQHLQNVNIPPNINGEIVLELEVKDSRVLRVIVDDEVSTMKDKKVVEEIKRSLLKWRVPSGAAEKIAITIKVNS